jgi:hypothetical protein
MKPGWASEYPQRADNWDSERDAMTWLLTKPIEDVVAMYEKWIRGDHRSAHPTWWHRLRAAFRVWTFGRCHHGVNTFLYPCARCIDQYHRAINYLNAVKPTVLVFYQSRDFWLNLDGLQFEHHVAALFRQLGKQADVTRSTGDSGVDIFLRDELGVIAVQCKAHHEAVGPAVVRDLYGSMAHFRAERGMVVSIGGFTAGARTFAAGKPIELIGLSELLLLQHKALGPR